MTVKHSYTVVWQNAAELQREIQRDIENGINK